MTSEKPNEHDGELRARLRNVDIPAGLKDRLLGISDDQPKPIPNPIPNPIPKPQSNSRLRNFVFIAIAASLLAVISIARWPASPPRQSAKQIDDSPSQQDATNDLTAPRQSPDLRQPAQPLENRLVDSGNSLDAFNSGQAEIDRILDQLELEQLRSQLATLKRNHRSPRLDPIDELSMILTLSDQTGIGFGQDVDSVRNDLKTTIERYPNSRGAQLAVTFLSENEF